MKLLIHDYSGHPFEVQLSRELARRGHNVRHLFSASFQSPRGALVRQQEDPPEFDVDSLSLREPLDKYSLFKRRRQEIEYGGLLARYVDEHRPDVVVSCNTPLHAQAQFLPRCRALGIKVVYWVQDLYGLAASKILRKKIPVLGSAVGRYFMYRERRMIAGSDQVVLITEDFQPLMDRWGVDAKKTHVIHNWAPLSEVPLRPKDNPWSRAHGLADKLCLLYSGTLAMKHNPARLLELAERFRPRDDVRVVVISEGRGADWLKEQKAAKGLDNLLLLGFQPFEQFPDVLGSADVLMSILESDAGVFSVPSKVLTYLCAGRPLLLAVPPENLASRIVSGHEAGLVSAPDDVHGFAEGASSLLADASLRDRLGRNARRYAETHFDIQAIGDRFEQILRV